MLWYWGDFHGIGRKLCHGSGRIDHGRCRLRSCDEWFVYYGSKSGWGGSDKGIFRDQWCDIIRNDLRHGDRSRSCRKSGRITDVLFLGGNLGKYAVIDLCYRRSLSYVRRKTAEAYRKTGISVFRTGAWLLASCGGSLCGHQWIYQLFSADLW